MAIYLDNLRVHTSIRVRTLCEDQDIRLIFAPVYSPDYNPIEFVFSQLKREVKK